MFTLRPQPGDELGIFGDIGRLLAQTGWGQGPEPMWAQGVVLIRGSQGPALEGLTGHWESHPRSRSTPAPEPERRPGEPWPSASPTLASPSVSMMTMEVLLSGTLCSSRALFSMLMALISPSLMLVTGTRQRDSTVRGYLQGTGLEEVGTAGPALGPKDPVGQRTVVLSRH